MLHGDTAGAARLLARRLLQAGWTVEAVPADWDRHGRRAGVLRDLSLLVRADALLAIWNGVSTATRTTMDLAARRQLPIACQIIPDRLQPAPPTGRQARAETTLAVGRTSS